MITIPYFQLSVLSLCDTVEHDEDVLVCRITNINGKKQEQASFPFNENVEISTPEYPEGSIYSIPTWYVSNDKDLKDASYELEIYSTKTKDFPVYNLTLKASELVNDFSSKTEICQNGSYVLYAESKVHSEGVSLTLTAKIAQPQLQAV
ncbi:hypothetical protein ACXGQW_11245 [Wenyingzhuangia sp. IMCC45533]